MGGVADVIVTDGLTGNIALKLMEGVSQTLLGAVRDAAMASTRAKLGGALLRPALREVRDELDPEEQGGAYLLGLRSLGVVPHGRFTRRGFARAILRARRGEQEDLRGKTQIALEQAGALRGGVGRPSSARPLACRRRDDPMTREQVFDLIQAHLADELDVDPENIGEDDRFKEDLEADSLDLYTLVQELEDTYGVEMSDEQAAKILTVGQAVDFVLENGTDG